MSALLGAWSLSGRPIRELLPDEAWARMLAARPAPGAGETLDEPRLRLCASAGRLRRRDARARAYEGWLAGPLEDAASIAAGADGHFVCADADLSAGRLVLRRDPSAGERLYYARLEGLLLFSSSLGPLLTHPAVGRRLDDEVARERALFDVAHFGPRSLIEGVLELLPGHSVEAGSGVGAQRWDWGPLLEDPEGPEEELARRFKERLYAATARAIGPSGRAAVALSGGVDSAAVAAAAVAAVGADNVKAFTFEFDEPGRAGEGARAAEICRDLGIRRHDVLRLRFEDCLAVVPELVRRSEEPTAWARPHAALLAARVGAAGYDRFLTGFGVGSHMGWLEDVEQALRWAPAGWLLRRWRAVRYEGARAVPSRLHPGLTPPDHPLPTPLYYLVVAALARRGDVADPGAFFPAPLAAAARALISSERARGAFAAVEGLPLSAQLQRLAFWSLDSCVDLHRLQRLCRESGSLWMSPFHVASCLPYAFFRPRPAAPFWSSARRARPGKRLLRRALRGVVADDVLDRPKVWSDAIPSDAWLLRVRERLAEAGRPALRALAESWKLDPADLERLCPNGALPLAFWSRVFVERGGAPVDWDALLAGAAGARR